MKDVHNNGPGKFPPARTTNNQANRPNQRHRALEPDPLTQGSEPSDQSDQKTAHESPQPHGRSPTPRNNSNQHRNISGPTKVSQREIRDRVYGALDLGTNNCRLLLARPTRRGFRVIDAFSRIIRLGEGVSQSGNLSEKAMDRTIDALKVCAGKIRRHNVTRARLVATEACRSAANGDIFLNRVRDQLGLNIELLTRESEARYAVSGCASLIDARCEHVLVFDIGGGSSELIWLDLRKRRSKSGRSFADRLEAQKCMSAWISLPVGVVTLAEHFGGDQVTPEQFEEMIAYVCDLLSPFEKKHGFQELSANGRTHLLGTSGTVTTVAGIHLGLRRYDRSRVDGCWLSTDEARNVTQLLLSQTHDERVAQPCIGSERADLVLAGCAILEALIQVWPCERMRVADRGLREGILATLMAEDGVHKILRRRPQNRSFRMRNA